MIVTPTTLTGNDGRKFLLTIGRTYEVLGIEAGHYRILSDENAKPYGNDPVLFEPEGFEIRDPDEPEFWVCEFGDDGERYCYPPEWSHAGFFEDFHDHIQEAEDIFWNGFKKYYPYTWKERKE